jgi:parallel beta-helix repeat protein
VVRRGVTLTILPGTVIKFAWVDEDGDDIGDGELTVEGRIIAKGTRENPILFTSAKDSPAPKDWTFVQISVSKDSLIEHSIFEYAFSGLQVHYSTATIHKSLFRNNFEGIRFSTTDILIEHNDILNNYYGIRCEANGSRTTVRKNRFLGNDNAFFPVRKTWDSVKVYDNNFEGSENYQVKMGQTQHKDLDFTNNWWGSTDSGLIAEGFFDKAMEPLLGRVKYEPFLLEPVKDAGMQ